MAEIDTPFHETFQRNGDPSDDEIFAYEGYRVEFDKLAMSYAVLALPIRFLCKEDCPGLGETHPVDVDFSLCQKELPGQHPFAALQQLLAQITRSEGAYDLQRMHRQMQKAWAPHSPPVFQRFPVQGI